MPNTPSTALTHNLWATDHFSDRILSWFYQYGRHNLPWQQLHTDKPDPYPVWISEIMLQQTQVATVIDYFERFMTRFATLSDLATADSDTVMTYWSGLGYYARARNLHKTAKDLHHHIQKTGDYPQTLDEWQALSGIGRSTAGAIMAMGMGRFGVICDGNVKRVLTRHFGIADDIQKTATDKKLWTLATQLTPQDNSNHYAQAMMDLGATLCTRTKPLCLQCPLAKTCFAHAQNQPTAYPVKAKPKPKPTHHSDVFLIRHKQQALWLKRPDDGIWGNLWCLPMTSNTLPKSPAEILIFDNLSTTQATPITSLRHTLTHFHWTLHLYTLTIDKHTFNTLNTQLQKNVITFTWQDKPSDTKLALPIAIKKLLHQQNLFTQAD